MRTRFTDDMKLAMKAGDKDKLSIIRLIIAALKEEDINARGSGREKAGDQEIMAMLQKMMKQRLESADIYDKGGRPELAAKERYEVEIISGYLPKQMADPAMKDAIASAITETNASTIKDMRKVIDVLKSKYPGQMDFVKASAVVKDMLGQR